MLGSLTAILVLSNAAAQWVGSAQHGDTACFLFGSPPRIHRYQTTTSQWLPPIMLPATHGPATCFAIDGDSIYVAFGGTVKRYDAAGGSEVPLVNSPDPVKEIFIDGDLVLINRSVSLYARWTSVSKTTNSVIDELENYVDATVGASIAPSINKIFGRSLGISPSDITYVTYADDGTFTGAGDSSYHGEFPDAARTWVLAGDHAVVDSAGIVYETGDLAQIATFGGPITDFASRGVDGSVVLRGSELLAYSSAMLPSGSRTLSFAPSKILVVGQNVLCLSADAGQPGGIRIEEVPLASLVPPSPGAPVDPHLLAFTPDASFTDKNGVVYLFSKARKSLFRWDSTTQTYLATIPLVGSPEFVAYSATNHRIYLAYGTGLIRQIDLSAPNLLEDVFALLALPPKGLATVDSYVFAVDDTGSWVSHSLFDPSGARVGYADWTYFSSEYVWSSVLQKMFMFRDDTSPNDLLWEEINADGVTYNGHPAGWIGQTRDSPLHTSVGFNHPIRVSPDGTYVLLGSGFMHDATTLARLGPKLGNAIVDAAWVDGRLRTIRTVAAGTQVQEWTQPTFALGATRQLPGTAHRLLELGPDRLVAISLSAGVPSFHVLNGGFSIIAPAVLPPPPEFEATIVSASQITLKWNDVNGEESYLIERRTGPDGEWSEAGMTPNDVTTFFDTGVLAGNHYSYRVRAINGTQNSDPSAEAPAAMVVPGAPSDFSAHTLSSSSVRVSWQDVEYETVYFLERMVGVGGTWGQVAQLPANTHEFTDATGVPNTHYYYRLRAANVLGTSPYSAVDDATTDAVAPTAPVLLTAVATGPFTIRLTWSDASYEVRYLIERRPFATGTWELVAEAAADTTSYIDASVAPATAYDFRIYATNAQGASPFSNAKSATTPQIPLPAAPVTMEARPDSASSVLVRWGDVEFESGYRVERRTEDLNSWVVVAAMPTNATAATITDLTKGVRYWFRVQAFNDFGSSPYSNEVDAVPIDIVPLLADSFDPGVAAGLWARISGGSPLTGPQGFRSGKALHFGAGAERSATTIALDVAAGGRIEFFLRAGNEAVDGSEFWSNSEIGESVVVEATRNGGASWTTLETIDTAFPALSDWAAFSVSIPPAAAGPATQLRWRQLSHSGVASDCWAIDDVVVFGPAPPPPAPVPFVISSAASSTSIAVLWIAADRASAYQVERRSGTNPWELITTVPAAVTYLTDLELLPETPYSYRVRSINPGGAAAYSLAVTSFTWSQAEEWTNENFGSPDALDEVGLARAAPDGTIPLLRFAFNLSADEPVRPLEPGGVSGYPVTWFDAARDRLLVEFVRRRAETYPGIVYSVGFSDGLSSWSTDATFLSATVIDSLWERVRFEDTVTRAQARSRFCRVEVQQ